MRLSNRALAAAACICWHATPLSAFLLPSTGRVMRTPILSTMESSPFSPETDNGGIDNDTMRQDIARMREEAQRRLDALNRELSLAKSTSAATATDNVVPLVSMPQDAPVDKQIIVTKDDNTNVAVVNEQPIASQAVEDALVKGRTKVNDKNTHTAVKTKAGNTKPMLSNRVAMKKITTADYVKRLENTRWRIMLNIGREPGTWMPKTWGVSGERLLMNLEVEFSPEALLDNDEFLNGRSGAKVLNVVHNELTMSPSMKEGSRKVHVRNGGWRIALGEGPMGTDVIRFYFDLAEQVRHKGSDVYAPSGRIFCTCGYFPAPGHRREAIDETSATSSKPVSISLKEEIRQEQMTLNAKYESLANEMDQDHSFVSWDKMMRAKEMMDLRTEAQKLNERMTEARVREPERSLLRLSRDQTIGLTKEGGVCCKVLKGLSVEYHILGKFEVAAMDNREHADYRELLP